MSDSTATDADREPSVELPSQGVRTTISLLLFIHLFCLFVAVVSNFGTSSALFQNLRDDTKIGAYLQALHMNLAFNYHFTYDTEEDFDHVLDILLDVPSESAADEPQAAQTKSLPVMPDACWTAVRRGRYARLADQVAEPAGNDAIESLLPDAIVNGLLAQAGIRNGGPYQFRCRTHAPQPLLFADEIAVDQRDPDHPLWWSNVLRFRVYRIGDPDAQNRRWGLLKFGERGQEARASGKASSGK